MANLEGNGTETSEFQNDGEYVNNSSTRIFEAIVTSEETQKPTFQRQSAPAKGGGARNHQITGAR